LISFNERISINGRLIPNQDIASFFLKFDTEIAKIKSTFYETTTALAFWYFKNNNVDVAVVETGLGGRLDSTNVLLPDVSVITPIGLDHCDRLGETISQIAREKAGIIKKNTPVLVSQKNETALSVIQEEAEKHSAPFILRGKVLEHCIENERSYFLYKEEKYNISLNGLHQCENAALAIETVRSFDTGINKHSIRNGIQQAGWKGRLEKISDKFNIYYDVAHNPQSIGVTLQTIASLYRMRPIGVMVLKDGKNISHISKKIKSRFKSLIVTSISGLGLYPSNVLKEALLKNGIMSNEIPHFETAMKKGQSLIGANRCLLIFGSHYIADKVYNEYDFSFGNGLK
jgi:dihydrofolate synthase/folylpolyglutamate synthase